MGFSAEEERGCCIETEDTQASGLVQMVMIRA